MEALRVLPLSASHKSLALSAEVLRKSLTRRTLPALVPVNPGTTHSLQNYPRRAVVLWTCRVWCRQQSPQTPAVWGSSSPSATQVLPPFLSSQPTSRPRTGRRRHSLHSRADPCPGPRTGRRRYTRCTPLRPTHIPGPRQDDPGTPFTPLRRRASDGPWSRNRPFLSPQSSDTGGRGLWGSGLEGRGPVARRVGNGSIPVATGSEGPDGRPFVVLPRVLRQVDGVSPSATPTSRPRWGGRGVCTGEERDEDSHVLLVERDGVTGSAESHRRLERHRPYRRLSDPRPRSLGPVGEGRLTSGLGRGFGREPDGSVQEDGSTTGPVG